MNPRIGIYGGSFDPPHTGHVMALAYALAVGKFEQIWVVPSWESALGKQMVPFHNRVQMCNLAFSSFGEKVEVVDIEAILQTRYTVDLLEHLKKEMPNYQFVLIVGSDYEPAKWHRWNDITEMVEVFVMGREGYMNFGSFCVQIPDVSSTHVRDALRTNEILYLNQALPTSVWEYIRQNKLYLEA